MTRAASGAGADRLGRDTPAAPSAARKSRRRQALAARLVTLGWCHSSTGLLAAAHRRRRAALGASREIEKIYLSRLGASTRGAITGAFDEGASLMSYVGHGGTAVWASENVFGNTDVGRLSSQPRQPFLMTMNCLNGFFHFPPMNSLSEQLLKADGKGVIGAFSPTGLSMDAPAHAYQMALVAEITSTRHRRLGDAILAAQAEYAASGALPELLSIYHLLGDPAMTLR
jgi:hypothetical protein